MAHPPRSPYVSASNHCPFDWQFGTLDFTLAKCCQDVSNSRQVAQTLCARMTSDFGKPPESLTANSLDFCPDKKSAGGARSCRRPAPGHASARRGAWLPAARIEAVPPAPGAAGDRLPSGSWPHKASGTMRLQLAFKAESWPCRTSIQGRKPGPFRCQGEENLTRGGAG